MKGNVEEIKQQMVGLKDSDPILAELSSTSNVSIWNLFLYIVARCFQDQRVYFDAHRTDVNWELTNQKSGTLPWYRQKALAFQYGFDLLADSDKFDNTTATETEIEDSKILKYAAVNESEESGRIIIKVATQIDNQLSPISEEQNTSLKEYFEEIKYAGTRITIINYIADKLFLNLKIYRDPLVINSDGVSILEGTKPVEDALLEFMKELPFNGELVLQSLVDKLQQVRGVKIAHLLEAKSSWVDALGSPTIINVKRIPESGYFKIENFDNITYVV